MSAALYPFSDTLAGHVTGFDRQKRCFTLRTYVGREFTAALMPTAWAQHLRNLGEPYQDCTGDLEHLLKPGQRLFAHGLFYPDTGPDHMEVDHLILCGLDSPVVEKEGWWVQQVRSMGDFLLRAEFTDSDDFHGYTTTLRRCGRKLQDGYQDVNSLSRFIYGLATAYLMTGEERFLQTAEQGAAYLRAYFRLYDTSEDLVLWYHALDIRTCPPRPVLGSEWPDDAGGVSAFDQAYALSGLAQLYRVNGDPELRADVERTLRTFDRYFHDPERGGYFSHIDPVRRDPRSDRLGQNRARKNWNSIGDHAPAYLFNLWLATGEERHARRLEDIFDLVGEHFPDFAHSPFVYERFHEDWTPDTTWGWQQNCGIVGHNLKIAWNLVRMYHLVPKEQYLALATRIAAVMPEVGMDTRRGGWFDALERLRAEKQHVHRFAWHDHKAWWQQEQAILAYLLLAGTRKDPPYLELARYSAAFYNAYFLDHEDGGIFFSVQATGLPYLLGSERFTASHYKAAYHTFELSYLAMVYNDLLIARRPVVLYFKPTAEGFPGRVLRAQPDVLPAGAVRIGGVWVADQAYSDFDPARLTIRLPDVRNRPPVRVLLLPSRG